LLKGSTGFRGVVSGRFAAKYLGAAEGTSTVYGFGLVSFLDSAGVVVVVTGGADLKCEAMGRRVGIGIEVELALLMGTGLPTTVWKGSELAGIREGVRDCGDSDVGKELAEALWDNSSRRREPPLLGVVL
jgi:hypothetical protein